MSLDAMKQALEALERGETKLRYEAITALRAAIEQAQRNEFNPDWDQVEALRESLREHMAEIQRLRQWQGLTPSEITAIELSLRQYHDGDRYDLSLADFASAIEAKLKAKNA